MRAFDSVQDLYYRTCTTGPVVQVTDVHPNKATKIVYYNVLQLRDLTPLYTTFTTFT